MAKGKHMYERTMYLLTGQTQYSLHNFVVRGIITVALTLIRDH